MIGRNETVGVSVVAPGPAFWHEGCNCKEIKHHLCLSISVLSFSSGHRKKTFREWHNHSHGPRSVKIHLDYHDHRSDVVSIVSSPEIFREETRVELRCAELLCEAEILWVQSYQEYC